MARTTYSFLDIKAAITGPGGVINLGEGAGISKEGITVDPTQDIDVMTIGADGSGMHSLIADKSGMVTLRLLKTSPTNQLLSAMAAFQRASGSLHGQNTISIVDKARGDVITCRGVAFRRIPAVTYAADGGLLEWTFNVIEIDVSLAGGIAG